MVGVGAFVADEKDYYMGIETDLYPEVGIIADLSVFRAGVKLGLIYRKVELQYWDSWGGSYYLRRQKNYRLEKIAGQFVDSSITGS